MNRITQEYKKYNIVKGGMVEMALSLGAEIADNRDLTNKNKVQSFVLKNKVTGEEIKIDLKLARIRRMQRRIFAWADTIKEYLPNYGKGSNYRKVMITLTYRTEFDWRPNQIRNYMKELRRRLGDRLIAYAWVAELQERGAVHYHIELICAKGTRIPMPDKSGMWKHGHSRIETVRTIYYICSYMKKEYQKNGEFPLGCRMYSVWISKKAVTAFAYWEFRKSTLPKWMIVIVDSLYDGTIIKWKKPPGGGYLVGDKLFRSDWVFSGLC